MTRLFHNWGGRTTADAQRAVVMIINKLGLIKLIIGSSYNYEYVQSGDSYHSPPRNLLPFVNFVKLDVFSVSC